MLLVNKRVTERVWDTGRLFIGKGVQGSIDQLAVMELKEVRAIGTQPLFEVNGSGASP